MKIVFTKPVGDFADDTLEGSVHLNGNTDSTACGIADEDWEFDSTNKPLTCTTCIGILKWAKEVAKIKS